MTQPDLNCDLAVVGGGPAGLAAALLLARRGTRVACFLGDAAIHGAAHDPRTTALMVPSLRLLAHLGIWPESLAGESAPLWSLRIVDDAGGLLPAPTVEFHARELGAEPFGWNVPNAALLAALRARLKAEAHALMIPAPAAAVEIAPEGVRLSDGAGHSVQVRLVLAADGRESLCRAAAGIKAQSWDYPQIAIAGSFEHSLPHRDCSIETHRRAGPLTTVPLPGLKSSLVWMEEPERARILLALAEGEFAAELAQGLRGALGEVVAVGPRAGFPVKGLTAQSFAARRILLIGEAGHVLPPIGAQGLNLSLRDAALAAELVADAAAKGDDPGGEDLLAAYDAGRRRDVAPRQIAVDLLNRTLLSGFLPAQAARRLGLTLLDLIGPLRREVMRQGLGESSDLRRAMRAEEAH